METIYVVCLSLAVIVFICAVARYLLVLSRDKLKAEIKRLEDVSTRRLKTIEVCWGKMALLRSENRRLEDALEFIIEYRGDVPIRPLSLLQEIDKCEACNIDRDNYVCPHHYLASVAAMSQSAITDLDEAICVIREAARAALDGEDL